MYILWGYQQNNTVLGSCQKEGKVMRNSATCISELQCIFFEEVWYLDGNLKRNYQFTLLGIQFRVLLSELLKTLDATQMQAK